MLMVCLSVVQWPIYNRVSVPVVPNDAIGSGSCGAVHYSTFGPSNRASWKLEAHDSGAFAA